MNDKEIKEAEDRIEKIIAKWFPQEKDNAFIVFASRKIVDIIKD